MSVHLVLPNRRHHITQKVRLADLRTLYLCGHDDPRPGKSFLRLKVFMSPSLASDMRGERQMKGHGEKQSRTEERAILALLAEPTLERAAKKCGIGVTTLWRWLQEPEFQRHYREARRTVFEETLLSLQSIAGEAVETLQRNLGSKNPSVEVRAALGILDQAVKAAELFELQQRDF